MFVPITILEGSKTSALLIDIPQIGKKRQEFVLPALRQRPVRLPSPNAAFAERRRERQMFRRFRPHSAHFAYVFPVTAKNRRPIDHR